MNDTNQGSRMARRSPMLTGIEALIGLAESRARESESQGGEA